MDAFGAFCKQYRHDPETGKKNYSIIQAEDELAAIGMVIGSNWCGARAFTATSGPGISLMSEFLGLAYYAEIPTVLFDIQRTGPSTGLPTRTQQCDILSCAYASHGDTKHILLFPGNPEECFYHAIKAFDLADQFQTPVIILSDIDIGMNEWMCPDLKWDESYKPNRGKIYTAEDLDKMENFYRYIDVDGDGITYRTLPGEHPKGAYFTRGTGHNPQGRYSEGEEDYIQNVDRLAKKFKNAALFVPPSIIKKQKGAKYGIIAIGSSGPAVLEAIDLLHADGHSFNYMRICGFPFHEDVETFMDEQELIFVIDQNRDAQLKSLLILETEVTKDKLRSVLSYGGLSLNSWDVVNRIKLSLPKKVAS